MHKHISISTMHIEILTVARRWVNTLATAFYNRFLNLSKRVQNAADTALCERL